MCAGERKSNQRGLQAYVFCNKWRGIFKAISSSEQGIAPLSRLACYAESDHVMVQGNDRDWVVVLGTLDMKWQHGNYLGAVMQLIRL